MQTVFELYATNAIEARLCNDIGAKTVTLPADSRHAARVQAQLERFHQARRRRRADTRAGGGGAYARSRARVSSHSIYEQAFGILQIMGDAEAEAT